MAQLLVRSGHKPVCTAKWNSPPNQKESIRIEELVEKIANLKDQGLTAAGIAWSFIKRRIQPLQERSVPGYLYKGPEDPSRLKEDLTHDEILERVGKFLTGVHSEPKTPPEYSATNSPPSEHIALYHSPPPLPEHLTADQMTEAEISGSKELISQRAKAAAQSSSGSKRPVEEGRLQVQVPKKSRTVAKVRMCHASEDKMPGCLPMTLVTTSSVILIDDIIALRKPVSIAAAPPMMTAAVLPSSAEASQHLTISVVHELGTRPSDNVSASEDKMPEGLPTLVAKSEDQPTTHPRRESAEAKLAEKKQERSAKLRTCHLAVLAVLEKQINSLKEENTKISTSLKEHAQTETILKEQLTNQMDCCKHAINQLREAQNTRKETYSQFLTSIQEIQTLNRSLAEAEEDKEKIKEAATPILKLVSRLSENQASTPFLDQLREVPGLIRVYCKKAARVCTSRVLGTVRAYYPGLDLTRVGEGKPKDCSAEDFASHIVAMEPVADSLIESFTL
ncbi:unnamed protein product [Miscanthus lutarioriparius]|uniref:Uncharacterized protein n=1 Tax=Miscanthus lutarioriparius TaxID=422564 RepID=A0A811SIW5_9POAL|nr:unnamed protein product [Miscanthus lutarioriparius]